MLKRTIDRLAFWWVLTHCTTGRAAWCNNNDEVEYDLDDTSVVEMAENESDCGAPTGPSPGPWHVRRWAGADVAIFAGETHIASCYLEENGVANGRLVASAPELLEALEGLYSNVADTDTGFIDLESGFMMRARTVIAKAAGE